MARRLANHLSRSLPVTMVLIISDNLCLFFCFFLGYLMRTFVIPQFMNIFHDQLHPFSTYLNVWWWTLPVFTIILSMEGAYSKRRVFWLELLYLYRATVLTLFIVFMMATITHQIGYISRVSTVFTGIFMLIFLPLFRLITKYLIFFLEHFKRRVLIIGTGDTGRKAAKFLEDNRYLGYRVEGFLEHSEADTDKGEIGRKILGPIGRLEELHRADRFDETLIAIPSLEHRQLLSLFSLCERYSEEVKIIPDMYGLSSFGSEIDSVNDTLVIRTTVSLNKRWNTFIKRFFDLFFSLLALILLSPLMLAAAVLIKLQDRGPVLFSETRVGRFERPFTFFKFRTMALGSERLLNEYMDNHPEAQDELTTFDKLKEDPRITPIGRFLRRTSIDELPQFFNVLIGDMSIVGPRPFRNDKFPSLGDYRELIVMARPGITGFWQTSGRNDIPFETRIEMDVFYVRNWSLWLDFIIIFKTIRAVVMQEGAF